MKLRTMEDSLPLLWESRSNVQISQNDRYELQRDSQYSKCTGNTDSGKSLQMNAVHCMATLTCLDIAQVLHT